MTLCPGFIDMQLNGGFGKEFKSDNDALVAVSSGIVEFGVTSIMPTITSLPQSTYRDHIAAIEERFRSEGGKAKVLGFHLEGPVLNPSKRGAHPEPYLVTADELDLDGILTGSVRVVTLAPEVPGGWSLAHKLVQTGRKVGIGHTLVSFSDFCDNANLREMHLVHAFNAMGEISAREPSAVGAALDNPAVFSSVIADLIHVHPALLRLLWQSREGGRGLFGISDGSAVLGLPIGEYQIGARTIERRTDRAVLSGTDTLVGSVLTMNIAARNIRSVTGCELWEAVNFVSRNAAEYLGITHEIGAIQQGLAADLCVIDSDFKVHTTMVAGEVVHGSFSS